MTLVHICSLLTMCREDPFAAPSKVHIEVPGQKAGFPKEYYDTEDKRTAVQDFVLRLFAGEVQTILFRQKVRGKVVYYL